MGVSAALALVLMGTFFTLFSYDLEDAIFARFVATAADGRRDDTGAIPLGMTAYVSHEGLPSWLGDALPLDTPRGEYEVFAQGRGHFHVAVRPDAPAGTTRYVVLDTTALTSTTRHLRRTSGLLLVSALLALLGAAGLSLVVARRLSRPLEQLVARVQSDTPAREEDVGVTEVRALAEALRVRDARIQELLERERAFNRDASHELRTPLAVAQGAVEILELDPPADTETFGRLRQAVHHMGLLTEGILWLARSGRADESCGLVSISREMVALYGKHRPHGDVELVIEAKEEVLAPLPGSVARVMLGNLIKNALAYTHQGRIVIHIAPEGWSISDTGVGFGRVEPGHMGFGIGLSLVERLAQRFNCDVAISAVEPHGTTVRLTWPSVRASQAEVSLPPSNQTARIWE
ncbi:two-component sensor histidine kinase [Myxococcus xanthus]|uniref:histidine kinase n=1 Tax=Myxococcus xanthus TaxID=34 RepID=A0AAE6KR87_MYXXA|nr:HAMP domain-containing sensor histidine kinase [Myxococcus xanthus]QDE67027.1 two-component sensor histidine kinase [Myxococcus xanthus]QDE74300.1 two-component sensor histidine kinase [Myxococcus xanthus]